MRDVFSDQLWGDSGSFPYVVVVQCYVCTHPNYEEGAVGIETIFSTLEY